MTIEFREDIQKLISAKHFKKFTSIQQDAMPLILKGKDVIGISATGTGKSHAFILPILQMVDVNKNETQAVIAAPTRELAIQLYNQVVEINQFNPDIRIKLIVSGKDKERMMESLKNIPHIVVGTIGRLKDLFVDESILRLDQARTLVIDEADMTLEMGFIDDVDAICGKLNRHLQMLVFSATVPPQLQSFLKKYMYRPTILDEKKSEDNQLKIRHVLVNCRYGSYGEKLLKILPGINPYVCMIFAKTKQEVIDTSALLKDNGYTVVEIHGDLNSRERKQALRDIASDKASYIVCSDIMARGLDIDAVSHVISLGLPSTLDYYTHRSGRTARAGRSGVSILLYNAKDIPQIKQLRTAGFNFEYQDYKRGQWQDVKPFDFRPKRKLSEADKEVQKIIHRPVKKVKPGYKKKKEAEIEQVRRRERRLMIKNSIKEQKKERAKKAQREKNGY